MVFPEALREQLVDEIVGRVLDHLDLFEDDLLLALDVVGAERRVADDVGEDVDRQRQMLVEHLDVVAGVFLRGERVELAADRVDRLRDVLGGARRGALEEHVLDEVRDAAALGGFVARAARQPDADADRADLRHPLGEKPKTVVEHVSDDGCVGHDEAWKALCDHRRGRALRNGLEVLDLADSGTAGARGGPRGARSSTVPRAADLPLDLQTRRHRHRRDDRFVARPARRAGGEFVLTTPTLAHREISMDGTEKFLLRLADGRHIESVFIPDTPAMTFCISTQVGCAMACAFCLTGKMGLVRNLTAGEIAGQVRVLADALGMRDKKFKT